MLIQRQNSWNTGRALFLSVVLVLIVGVIIPVRVKRFG